MEELIIFYLHSLMVLSPSLSEDLTFIVQLFRDIIAQVLKAFLEFILESIQYVMYVPHSVHCLLFVLLNLTS